VWSACSPIRTFRAASSTRGRSRRDRHDADSSPRALPADALGAVAVEIFGADRVTVEPRLDDAIETAVRLAEESDDDILAGAGVLITGSVITAGEARALLVRPGS
jgi:dihydrofolate synthase/folylpolyglutamate synthase